MKITFDVREFVSAIKVVSDHASADTTRPHINCVHVRLLSESVDIVATDGHRLALYRFASPRFDLSANSAGATATIPLSVVLAFVKSAKGQKSGPATIDSVKGTISAGAVSVSWDTADAPMFPPYEQIMPKKLAPLSMPIDAHYVCEAADAFCALAKSTSTRTRMLSIMGSGELSPVVFTSQCVPELLIVIMPVRGDMNCVAPSALFESSARLPGDRTAVEFANDAAAE